MAGVVPPFPLAPPTARPATDAPGRAAAWDAFASWVRAHATHTLPQFVPGLSRRTAWDWVRAPDLPREVRQHLVRRARSTHMPQPVLLALAERADLSEAEVSTLLTLPIQRLADRVAVGQAVTEAQLRALVTGPETRGFVRPPAPDATPGAWAQDPLRRPDSATGSATWAWGPYLTWRTGAWALSNPRLLLPEGWARRTAGRLRMVEQQNRDEREEGDGLAGVELGSLGGVVPRAHARTLAMGLVLRADTPPDALGDLLQLDDMAAWEWLGTHQGLVGLVPPPVRHRLAEQVMRQDTVPEERRRDVLSFLVHDPGTTAALRARALVTALELDAQLADDAWLRLDPPDLDALLGTDPPGPQLSALLLAHGTRSLRLQVVQALARLSARRTGTPGPTPAGARPGGSGRDPAR